MQMRKTKQSRCGGGMGPQKPARDMSATAQRALRKILLVVLPSDGDACSFLCSREITTIDQRIFKHKEKREYPPVLWFAHKDSEFVQKNLSHHSVAHYYQLLN